MEPYDTTTYEGIKLDEICKIGVKKAPEESMPTQVEDTITEAGLAQEDAEYRVDTVPNQLNPLSEELLFP
jgi:hypothetical protein